MLGEERDRINKSEQKRKDKQILKEVKQSNIERVTHGQEPVYLKKSKFTIIVLNINRGIKGLKIQGEVR